MSERIFIDSGAFIALGNKRDQYHIQAASKIEPLLKDRAPLLTTTHVFAEAVTKIR